MTDKNSFVDNVILNFIFKILQFVVFSLITSAPYLINNLDKVASKVAESGASGFMIILAYIQVISGSILYGMGIGLSTVFYLITHLSYVLSNQMYGTIIYSIIVVVFATLTFYQPIDFIFGMISKSNGKENSHIISSLVAFVVVIVIASPIAYLINDGATITSGLEKDSVKVQDLEINDTIINNTNVNITNDSKLINSINMLNW